MVSPLNAFFSSNYALAAIETLFAPLSWNGSQAASSTHSATGQFNSQKTWNTAAASPANAAFSNLNVILTANGADVTATSAHAGPGGTEAQTTVSHASAITVTVPPGLQDLANEEAVLTGNNVGVVRPSVGPSKFTDALLKLATGSDLALAVAARSLLPRIVSVGNYGPDGQDNVTYHLDPAEMALDTKNLPNVAIAMATRGWTDDTVSRIAGAMANGDQPSQFDVNFLHAKLFGSFTVMDTKAMAGDTSMSQYNTDVNGNMCSSSSEGWSFNWEVVLNPGTQPLASYSATSVHAQFKEF